MAQAYTSTADNEFDAEGYLSDPAQWNAALAENMAQEAGIETLTRQHWQVIDYLRQHHLNYHSLPPKRQICETLNMAEACIGELFNGDMRIAWRVAGLPNPGEEAKTYMSNSQ